MATERKVSLLAALQALIVRFVYALNGIVLTFFVYNVTKESRIFFINALLVPSAIEVAITLKYKKKGEWTWFIPSVFIYLLWVVPCIIVLEIYALNFRTHVVSSTGISSCPVVFYDECRTAVVEAIGGEDHVVQDGIGGTNTTDNVLNPETHDLSRYYSMLFQQIMMLVIIFGRWMAPKGKLSRDQLSSLLLALTAMALDMLEFATDSLSIEAVACDKIYVGFIITVWCWSLLQIPLGLTAVKQRKPRVAGPIEADDSSDGSGTVETGKGNGCNWKAHCCCCCESEIWSLTVSIFMQDGPYLILRLYIMFSTGYVGETLIFFATKNTLIVMLQTYRIIVKVNQGLRKRREGNSMKGHPTPPDANEHQIVTAEGFQNGGFEDQGGRDLESGVVTISLEGSHVSDDGGASHGEDALQDEEATQSLGASRGPKVTQENSSADVGFQESTDVSFEVSDEVTPREGSHVSDDGGATHGEDALQDEEATQSLGASRGPKVAQENSSADVGFQESTDVAFEVSDEVTPNTDEKVC